jgi:thiamine-phosphate pyrophosphorylase
MGQAGCRLYLITPPVLPPNFADLLASALDAGDVAAVQLRLKDVPDDALQRTIDQLRPIVQSRGVAFLLNDRPELAVKTGCDGAHVGQSDMKAPAARKILKDLTLGVTCHGSRHLAMQARTAPITSPSAPSIPPPPRNRRKWRRWKPWNGGRK